MLQPPLVTVSVYRRDYGHRYTDLPVDQLDSTGFVIDCSTSHARPAHYDLRQGDIVRWRAGERYIEAVISAVSRDATTLRVEFSGAHLLPPEFVPY